MTPPLRLAVLECDTPLDRTRAAYGGYGGVFEALLNAGADLLASTNHQPRPQLEVTKYDVVNAEVYPDLDSVDAVLLTGSRHNAFDNSPWILKLVAFTRAILRPPPGQRQRVKVIGVCFGHQIVGRALDARVDRSDAGWEVSVTPMRLTAKGREIFGVLPGDLMQLHQMHRDIVYFAPPGVEELAHTDRCSVQGMYAAGRFITVQGHPEFTDAIVTEILAARHAAGVFPDDVFEDGMARVEKKHDGVVVARAFLEFVMRG